MWRVYRQRLTERADAVAAKGHVVHLLSGIWRDAAVWVAPIAFAVVVWALFDVSGPESLLLSLPALSITFAGVILYVPWVYLRAFRQRWNGS